MESRHDGSYHSDNDHRFEWRDMDFSSIKGLGDKVFAFAMTLLAYNLVIPDSASGDLAEALMAQVPQFLAFILSFAVAAQIWWQHHKLTSMFQGMEPVMVGLYFLLLAAVVLVPFVAALVGRAPNARAAVMLFIGLFIVINCIAILLTLRAQSVSAWRTPVSTWMFYWLVFNFFGGNVVLTAAFFVSIWYPTSGLLIVATGAVIGPLVAQRFHIPYASSD